MIQGYLIHFFLYQLIQVYWLSLHAAGGLDAAMAPAWFGFLPVMWGFVAGVAGALIGTLSCPREEVIA